MNGNGNGNVVRSWISVSFAVVVDRVISGIGRRIERLSCFLFHLLLL